MTIKLSNVNPDFDSIVSQITAELSLRKSWKDVLPSSTGQFLIEAISGTASLVYSELFRSVEEVFMNTAVNKSSIFNIANMVGVNPRRATGGEVTCNLTIPFAIPVSISFNKYDKFTIEGVEFFLTAPVTIPANTTSVGNVLLRQGSVNIHTFISTGEKWQQLIVGSNFLSDNDYLDVKVGSDTTFWTRSTNPLWEFTSSDKVFMDTTLPDGTVRVMFGNGVYGVVPSFGEIITIYEIVSIGKSSNKTSSSLVVSPVDQPLYNNSPVNLSGLTTTSISNGDDSEDAETVRYTSPRIFASGKRAITRSDYKALGLKFQGVRDINIWGAYEEDITQNNPQVPKYGSTYWSQSSLSAFTPDNVNNHLKDDQAFHLDSSGSGAYLKFSGASGELFMFTGVKITALGLYTATWDIEYSDDDTTWVKAATGWNSGTSVISSTTWKNVGEHRYWRLLKMNSGVAGAYISEVQFFESPLKSMNTVKVTLLTDNGVATQSQKDAFDNYIANSKHLITKIVHKDAVPVKLCINIDLYVHLGFSLEQTKTQVLSAINNYFLLQRGVLGRSVFVSDIIGLANSVPGVDYSILKSSLKPTGLSIVKHPGSPSLSTSTSGGTLPAATYYYRITAFNGTIETGVGGETSQVTTGSTSSNTLSWTAVPGATKYRVYRGTVAGVQTVYYETSTNGYVDTGSVAITGAPPAVGVIAGGGTPHTYIVTALDLNGLETDHSDVISITYTTAGSGALAWSAVPGATKYRIYRTQTNVYSLYYEVPGNVLGFSDFGNAALTGNPPVISIPQVNLEKNEYITLQPTPVINVFLSGR